jgi:hypothetical protein
LVLKLIVKLLLSLYSKCQLVELYSKRQVLPFHTTDSSLFHLSNFLG